MAPTLIAGTVEDRIATCNAKGIPVYTFSATNDPGSSFGMGLIPDQTIGGLQVITIDPNRNAGKAGVTRGHVLLSVDGRSDLTTEADLFALLRSLPQPGTVELVVAAPYPVTQKSAAQPALSPGKVAVAVGDMEMRPLPSGNAPSTAMAYERPYED